MQILCQGEMNYLLLIINNPCRIQLLNITTNFKGGYIFVLLQKGIGVMQCSSGCPGVVGTKTTQRNILIDCN